jgi:hypothetical protein
MKRSKFTDEQILAIVKGGEAGRKVADLCRTRDHRADRSGFWGQVTALSLPGTAEVTHISVRPMLKSY